MIRQIFFDIGDTLFDEDAQHQYYSHSLLLALRRNGVEAVWDDYRARIQSCVRIAPTTAIKDAAKSYVADEARFEKIYHEGRAEYDQMRAPRPYGMLLDGIEGVLRDLHADFALGVIANQHPPVAEALRDYGLSPLFNVVALDEVVGISKPDPRLYLWALEKAGCRPGEAIMVGDRPDHDIAPAKSLGMRTMRFRRGTLYPFYDPRTEEERADVMVTDVSRIAAAVRRLVNP